jgi:hypothetical protein
VLGDRLLQILQPMLQGTISLKHLIQDGLPVLVPSIFITTIMNLLHDDIFETTLNKMAAKLMCSIVATADPSQSNTG